MHNYQLIISRRGAEGAKKRSGGGLRKIGNGGNGGKFGVIGKKKMIEC